MKIRQTATSITNHFVLRALKNSVMLGVMTIAVVASALASQNILTKPTNAYAVTPPDSCFVFSSVTGAIRS